MDSRIFSTKVRELLDRMDGEVAPCLEKASEIIFSSMKNDGLLHVFSTGHSHMIAEEFFYRAGGLIPVNPILNPFLMQHEGAVSSTKFERLSGVAKIIYEGAGIKDGEPIIIASNSGINTVPVEMALYAREHGCPVIAITSAKTSMSAVSRHASGKRLCEVADVVIDTGVPKGDSVVEVREGLMTGSVSSVVCLYAVQKIAIGVVENFLKAGLEPPIFKSANLPGGDEYNAKLLEKYKGRIRSLY